MVAKFKHGENNMARIKGCRPQVWIHDSRLNQRVSIHINKDIWPRKFRQFAHKILEQGEAFSVRKAARITGVSRETAKKYIKIMERNGLLDSFNAGASKETTFLVHQGTLLEMLEASIRNQPGILTEVYNNLRNAISPDQIMKVLDSSSAF
jgi:DNA-binding transcriptional regulator YhcF (GntR family)